jgi:hypothetical protein
MRIHRYIRDSSINRGFWDGWTASIIVVMPADKDGPSAVTSCQSMEKERAVVESQRAPPPLLEAKAVPAELNSRSLADPPRLSGKCAGGSTQDVDSGSSVHRNGNVDVAHLY